MKWRDVAHVLRDVTLGLVAFHTTGGCHRDIKPSNLLAWRSPDGGGWHVKVSDFGVARRGPPRPGVNDVAGTPAYWAPEIRQGAPQTAASDAYALGLTALELLTGGHDPDVLSALAIPPGLKSLVIRLLHPNPAFRPIHSELIERIAPLIVVQPTRSPSIALPAAIVASIWLAARIR